MLIFYRKSLEKNIEKFIEDIRKASKNLDKENQKFIEDIFLEKRMVLNTLIMLLI